MYGVFRVSHEWYEGSQNTKTTMLWWDGSAWSEDPVENGPFATREAAEAFAAEKQKDAPRRVRYADYGAGDPFGEDQNYYPHEE